METIRHTNFIHESRLVDNKKLILLNYQKVIAVRYPGRECKEDLVYVELKLCCHHGGKKPISRSKGDRPN